MSANTRDEDFNCQLNKFVEKAVQTYHPPMIQGKRLRIFYMAHVETQPPTFVLFVNYPKLMLETYQTYLVTKFRKSINSRESPSIRLTRSENGKPVLKLPRSLKKWKQGVEKQHPLITQGKVVG
jgi:GTP-binding protein